MADSMFQFVSADGKNRNRIDTEANWTSANPVLNKGEIGIATGTYGMSLKIGDGSTAWNSLAWAAGARHCPFAVGDIYQTLSTVAPATRWPGTTWEKFAPGRVLIGAGTGKDTRSESKTFSAGATGGEYNHVLTTGELAEHTHSLNYKIATSITTGTSGTWFVDGGSYSYTGTYTGSINKTGSNTAHNNLSPYYVVRLYKRTA